MHYDGIIALGRLPSGKGALFFVPAMFFCLLSVRFHHTLFTRTTTLPAHFRDTVGHLLCLCLPTSISVILEPEVYRLKLSCRDPVACVGFY